jgi:hypothetical protein
MALTPRPTSSVLVSERTEQLFQALNSDDPSVVQTSIEKFTVFLHGEHGVSTSEAPYEHAEGSILDEYLSASPECAELFHLWKSSVEVANVI